VVDDAPISAKAGIAVSRAVRGTQAAIAVALVKLRLAGRTEVGSACALCIMRLFYLPQPRDSYRSTSLRA